MQLHTPFCPKCKTLLKKENGISKTWEYYNCSKCNFGEAVPIGKWLRTDEETNLLFHQIAVRLRDELDLTIKEAINYTEEFYLKFTDEAYCAAIGTPPKDDDFFHHELFNLLLYISYFIIDKKETDFNTFLQWRIEQN